MHNHVIAGDWGYMPTYSDEDGTIVSVHGRGGYTYGSEALEALKEYVNTVVDSVELDPEPETPEQYDKLQKTQTDEEFWLATGVVKSIGTDGCKHTIQVVFDRNLVSIDYAEITVCYEFHEWKGEGDAMR
jgi:hypothetical protein